MDEVIKREEASEIARKLNECRNHMQRGNIYSCIVCFKEALEKIMTTKMLASDEKELKKNVNLFQKHLSESRTFRDVFGPVTFRDDDFTTSFAFIKQLIHIKDEETLALVAEKEAKNADLQEKSGQPDDTPNKIRQIKVFIEKGDHAIARETIAEDEEIISFLVEEYNSLGILHRREGRYDEAISEFKKALVVQPRDEGLYYNIARVSIAKEEWKEAADVICEGLKINPRFEEGIKLLKYIRETGRIDC
jgi:tetratricopeptide (TPR) repeat protein